MARRKRFAASGLLLLALLGPALVSGAPAAAHESSRSNRWSELQKRINDTRARIRNAKARERGIIAQINASDLRRQRLEDALSSIGVQLNQATDRLEVVETSLGRTEVQLDRRTQELENTLALLDEQNRLMGARAAEKYMSGPMTFTPVLFNTTDFIAFVAANQYVASVLHADADMLSQIRQIRDQIQAERVLLGEQKAALSEQAARVARERNQIAQIRSKQARARRAVVGELNYRKSLLAKVRNEREAYEEALQSYVRESDSITGILRDSQKGQKVIQGAGKGYLVWPVSGRISSGYGWRVHPIYKKRAFHTGIDIAAPSGSKLIAGRDGKVVYTGYKGAFGLIVLVDHGNSVATMFAHLSRASVAPGQKVKRGQTVGAVGCTGWCTGPHVHFEVRVAGEPTNPMRWL